MLKSVKQCAMILLVLLGANSVFAMEHVLALRDAKLQFADDPDKLQEAKGRIVAYYEDGAYAAEVREICERAFDYFKEQEIVENAAIVWDVDETALTDYDLFKELNFEWHPKKEPFEYRLKGQCKPIAPMLELFLKLKKLGYKHLFVTARRAALEVATSQNLKHEGYAFDELVLLPMDLFERDAPSGPWKESVRKKLAERYIIAGSISDAQRDLEGECCGYTVKLPNYLY